jgi:hypothetical protein
MTTPATIECTVHFHRRGHGARKELQAGAEPLPPAERIPRLARLLALAHRCERLLQTGVVKDYATLARLGHVSRARICQIVSLLQLAPDIHRGQCECHRQDMKDWGQECGATACSWSAWPKMAALSNWDSSQGRSGRQARSCPCCLSPGRERSSRFRFRPLQSAWESGTGTRFAPTLLPVPSWGSIVLVVPDHSINRTDSNVQVKALVGGSPAPVAGRKGTIVGGNGDPDSVVVA